jgi:beta-glucosidase
MAAAMLEGHRLPWVSSHVTLTFNVTEGGTVRRIYALLAAALIAAVTIAVGVTSGSASTRPTYLDPSAPIQARVRDLLSRMTLREKAGQMDQIVVEVLRAPTNPPPGSACNTGDGNNNDQLQQTCLQTVLADNATGSVLSGGTDNPPGNKGADWANQYNTIQQFAITHSRLHIPILYGVDAVHGFGHPYTATLFPQSIGMGATWDTTLAKEAGAATCQQLVATGSLWDFAPVQDVARDNRWGRYYETWAEEPALSAAIGGANVAGLQSDCTSGSPLRVTATVKHFAGYSDSINGHDRVEAQIPIRYLQDLFLPSYAGAINAGAGTVMVDSGSINGIPATASHFLLTTELRGRLGFKGVVISDYGDVPALQTTYHIAPDLATAAAEAVNAGVDMAMEPFDSTAWDNAIIQDVTDGAIPMWRINQAVTRILTLKFNLGLFDNPYVDPSKAEAAIEGNAALARQAADESMTLLRNQGGVLPLSPTAHVVVTGPSADGIPGVANMLGGWSVSWQGVYDNGVQNCCAGPADQVPPNAVTVYQGIKAADPNATLAPDQATAVSDASSATVYVAVVGETPYAEGLGDNPQPALTADQQALITALEATGKPVIVVVLAGRPIGLGPAAEKADGILMAYLPGSQGGNGVADVLFGKYDPSGRLPVTWPSDATPPQASDFNGGGASVLGDEPKFFDQLPGTNFGHGSGYNPLYPFGFGLSYTTFSTGAPTVSGPSHGVVTVTFTASNTGTRDGTDVVPVYVSEPVNMNTILRPSLQLVGFARVPLTAGQTTTVTVPFSVWQLAVTPGDIDGTGPQQLQPGAYTVQVGSATAGFTIH